MGAAPQTPDNMLESQPILCPRCHRPSKSSANFCLHCGHDLALNNEGHRYYITRVIKEGGQGAVYEAIDREGRVYAVKEMLDRFTNPRDRDDALNRFAAEANLLQHLSHPRIPRVYHAFKDEGRQYLAMDYVRGEDLEDVIRRRGALPEAEVLSMAEQLCDVIEYLHGRRPPIIFRDLKPSNIMIEPNGSIKLIDFGIAKMFQALQRGTQIGTPGYAPPEQYQGRATPASDIYSLAATLHHALTGRDPRDEERPSFSFPAVRELQPRVSRQTSDAIARALQFQEEQRPQNIGEFARALPMRRLAPTEVMRTDVVRTPPPPAPPVTRAPVAAPPSVLGRPAGAAPAARSVPIPPAIVTPPTTASARPAQKQGCALWRGCANLLVTLIMIGLIACTLWFVVPEALRTILPGVTTNTTAAPAAQIPVRFDVVDIQVVVPTGKEVRQAFIEEYTRRAVERYGPGTRVSANQPPAYSGGEPQEIASDASSTTYRGSMSGWVVPSQ